MFLNIFCNKKKKIVYEIIKHNNELHFVFEFMNQNLY
jgi:hypothetical protein